MRTVAIIQARMGSSRFPGKVVKTVLNTPLIAWMLGQVEQAKKLDRIVVATSTEKMDDTILKAVEGTPVYRGPHEDVLARFLGAAREAKADTVVRLTADCPLIDPAIIDEAIELFQTGQYDYVTNALERTYPKGMDVEVFSMKALEEMAKNASDPYEREHVTPYLYQGKRKTKIGHLKQKKNDSDLRITVDTPEDFAVVKEVIEALDPDFSLKTVVSFLRRQG